MSPRSRWLVALEVVAWVTLAVIAVGASLLISLLVSIDCNGIWNDRQDQACVNRTSWMALIPVALLAALVGARVLFHRRRAR